MFNHFEIIEAVKLNASSSNAIGWRLCCCSFDIIESLIDVIAVSRLFETGTSFDSRILC